MIYFENPLLFFVIFLLFIAFFLPLFLFAFQCTGSRTAAQPHGNTDHHTETEVVRHDPEENAEAQTDGKAKGTAGGNIRVFFCRSCLSEAS